MGIKVKADKYKKFVDNRKGIFGSMLSGCEVTPVDLYGKRVNLNKDDKDNMEKTGQDIREFYGLE